MIIEDLEQGSPDWLAMRCGIVTGSRVCDVMSTRKDKKEAADRANYRKELVWENLTGLTAPKFVTAAMENGTLNEPFARAEYEIRYGVEVRQIGLAIHSTVPKFAASPDGLVGEEGMLEIKCPGSLTHLDTILCKEIPPEYHWQMYAEMACAERKWCDFVSFDPRMPRNLQLFVKRFYWDAERIAQMEAEVRKFTGEVEALLAQLKDAPEIPPTLEGALVESLKAVTQ